MRQKDNQFTLITEKRLEHKVTEWQLFENVHIYLFVFSLK